MTRAVSDAQVREGRRLYRKGGWTTKQMAEKWGVSPTHASRLLRGQRSGRRSSNAHTEQLTRDQEIERLMATVAECDQKRVRRAAGRIAGEIRRVRSDGRTRGRPGKRSPRGPHRHADHLGREYGLVAMRVGSLMARDDD
jgi:hypothetical protein